MQIRYKQNDVIKFAIPFSGKGKIVGWAGSFPYLGNGWLVEIITPIPDYMEYEYTHTIIYDIHITEDV